MTSAFISPLRPFHPFHPYQAIHHSISICSTKRSISTFRKSVITMGRTVKTLVIGCGTASGYFAREYLKQRGIAKLDADDLLIIGKEKYAPYERPALSKGFLFADPPARLPGFHVCVGSGGERQPPEWYAEHGVELKLGEEVVGLDSQSKTVTLSNGESITASNAIVLATGAKPIVLSKMPGNSLKGVHYLREYDDGLALYQALKNATGKHVVVIGGGYIGLEVGAAANLMGCKVTLVFPEEHVMPRLFNRDIAHHYETFYKSKGVDLLNNGRLCKAILDDGHGNVRGILMCKDSVETEVACDLVVIGVGAVPNIGLVNGKSEFVMSNGGIQVNEHFETSVAGVYAVGDIASFPQKLYGGQLARLEHVGLARASAAHAAQCILGKKSAFEYLPFFYSRVFSLSWQFYGDSRSSDKVVTVGKFDPKLLTFWFRPVDESGSGKLKVVGVFMESPSNSDVEDMKVIATAMPVFDPKALDGVTNVEEGLKLVVTTISKASH